MKQANTTSERVVCYLDVMGFSQSVQKSSSSREQLEGLVSILEEVQSTVLEGYSGTKLVFQNLSDSIFVATQSTNSEEIEHLILCIQDITILLMGRGYLVRGGFSSGLCSVSPNIVVGESVVHAVKLEEQVAQFPRIVVSGKTYNSIKDTVVAARNIERSEDGIYWVNPFSILTRPVLELHNNWIEAKKNNEELANNLQIQRDELISKINKINTFICQNLIEITENERLFRKYFWIFNVAKKSISECKAVIGSEIHDMDFTL